MQFPPVRRPDVAHPEYEGGNFLEPTSPTHNDLTVDQFHIEDRFSGTALHPNYSFYGDGTPSDSGGTRGPYPETTEFCPPLDHVHATPTIARETDTWGHIDPSGSRPARGARNEEAAQPFERSPSIGSKKAGSKRPNKRKRAMTPDEGRKAKHSKRKSPRRLDPRGPTQVGIVQFKPAREWLVTALILDNDNPPCHTAHTP